MFAIDEGIGIARANLVTVYSTFPDIDDYADHSAAITSRFTLYDGMQPVTHHLYLGHDSLFSLAGSVDLTLEFDLESTLQPSGTTKSGKPKLPKGLALAWEYLTQDGWVPFDPIDDHTFGLAIAAEVGLHKRFGPPTNQQAIDGVQSYWIRGRLETPLLAYGSKDQPQLPTLNTVRARLGLNHGALPCDAGFSDDLQIDTSKDFQPFGPQPAIGSSFVVACDQAFQQAGASIGISITLTNPANVTPTANLNLYWEYSSGPGTWNALGGSGSEFRDNTQNFSAQSAVDPAITFNRPDDWAQVNLNGQQHYWLRVRITNGGYGGPPTYTVQSSGGNWQVVASDLPGPPQIAALAFSYTYQIGPFVPDHCLALNGFAFGDFTDACRWGRTPFQPFVPLPDRYPAIYFGFDQPLPVGLASLYIDIPGDGNPPPGGAPVYVWEYQAADGWAQLSALDETAGFTRSGMVQLIGPPDLTAGPGPAGPTYWVRARTQEPQDPSPSDVNAIYMNAGWATHRDSAITETLGRSDGTPSQAMLTQHAPVLEGEVLEVQEWTGTGREWETLFADVPPSRLRYDTDPRGNVTAVWVTWEGVPYLYGSSAQDRVYTLERTTGLVRFGIAIPPPGSPVAISYDYGGGTAGNVAAGAITQLHSAIPNLQQVGNPVVAAGGAAGETIAEVRRRGPQHLKNSGRAVAEGDYEWLAREASPEVAVARCLATTGPDGYAEPGWVTVLIVPQGTVDQPQPSQELISRVREALMAQAPAAITGQIRIVGPTYRAVSVVAEVTPGDPSQAAQVENALSQRLSTFLHPVNGGPDGTGWEFGQPVHLSQVVEVILGTAGVLATPHVALLADTQVYSDAVPIPADWLPCSGKHELKLTIGIA